jgi:hypothetical protein
MGFDAVQDRLPANVLAIDFAQISYEEGIFLANFARVVINSFDSALQSMADQTFRFSKSPAMVVPDYSVGLEAIGMVQ